MRKAPLTLQRISNCYLREVKKIARMQGYKRIMVRKRRIRRLNVSNYLILKRNQDPLANTKVVNQQ